MGGGVPVFDLVGLVVVVALVHVLVDIGVEPRLGLQLHRNIINPYHHIAHIEADTNLNAKRDRE